MEARVPGGPLWIAVASPVHFAGRGTWSILAASLQLRKPRRFTLRMPVHVESGFSLLPFLPTGVPIHVSALRISATEFAGPIEIAGPIGVREQR